MFTSLFGKRTTQTFQLLSLLICSVLDYGGGDAWNGYIKSWMFGPQLPQRPRIPRKMRDITQQWVEASHFALLVQWFSIFGSQPEDAGSIPTQSIRQWLVIVVLPNVSSDIKLY